MCRSPWACSSAIAASAGTQPPLPGRCLGPLSLSPRAPRSAAAAPAPVILSPRLRPPWIQQASPGMSCPLRRPPTPARQGCVPTLRRRRLRRRRLRRWRAHPSPPGGGAPRQASVWRLGVAGAVQVAVLRPLRYDRSGTPLERRRRLCRQWRRRRRRQRCCCCRRRRNRRRQRLCHRLGPCFRGRDAGVRLALPLLRQAGGARLHSMQAVTTAGRCGAGAGAERTK